MKIKNLIILFLILISPLISPNLFLEAYINSDSGELALDTQSLTHSDMKGYDKSMTIGGGTSMGVDFLKNSNGSTSYNVNAPSRTNIKFGMTDREQTNRATIGAGTITIGGKQATSDDPALAGLNRNMSKKQEITKDQKIDTIDIDVDHRLLTEKGREEIKNQVKTAVVTVKDNVSVAGEVLTGKAKVSDAGSLLAGSYNREDAIVKLSQNPENKKALQALADPKASQKDIDSAVNLVTHELMKEYGYTEEEAKKLVVYTYANSNDNTNGFREKQDNSGKILAGNQGQIGINMENTGKSTNQYYETVNHELGHAEAADMKKNEADSEQFADSMGRVGKGAMDNGLWMSGMGGLGVQAIPKNDKFTFDNTKQIGSTYSFDDLVHAQGNNSKARSVGINNRENQMFVPVAIDGEISKTGEFQYNLTPSDPYYNKQIKGVGKSLVEFSNLGSAMINAKDAGNSLNQGNYTDAALQTAMGAAALVGGTLVNKGADLAKQGLKAGKKIGEEILEQVTNKIDDVVISKTANKTSDITKNIEKTAEEVGEKAKFVYDKNVQRYRNTETGQFTAQKDLPYPGNDGFEHYTVETMQTGKITERNGKLQGSYAGEVGSSVSGRGLPPGSDDLPKYKIEALQPITGVKQGPAKAVPEFNAKGGDQVYKFPKPLEQLEKENVIKIYR